MKDSKAATATMPTWPGTTPNDSRSTVRIARFSAGLTSGKNFSTPKARNTAPTAIRSAVMPWRTSTPCTIPSTLTKRCAI